MTADALRILAIVASVMAVRCSTPAGTPQSTSAPAVASPDPGLRLPAGVTPLSYDLQLDLDPDRDTFTGRVEIRVRLEAPTQTVWIHADALEIATARYHAAGRSGSLVVAAASTVHEMRSLGFGSVMPSGEVTLELSYRGQIAEELEGLFRQRFGEHWFVYSQAEATYARRILPCFDEPRWKVPWRVTVTVPDGNVAIANAPVERERVLDGKRREIRFAEIAGLPTFLFAIAVGPFALVELPRAGKHGVPVRAAVAPGDAKRVGATATWVPKLVDVLEQYFDRPLPLAKLDLVAVPRFFGAMENPGLITFEVTALVGAEHDPVFLRRHLRFLAHELAHQWFGNAVTPAWWNDLWLAEAFATWLDDKLANALGPIDDAPLRTQLARSHALAADRALAAKPLRRAITTNADIEDAFDAISYEKGAAVITMFEQFVGEERFRDVIRAYIKRDRLTTSQDFVAELARVDAAAGSAFASYLDKPGAPIVDLALDCTSTARVIATPRDGARVPICIRHPGGRTCVLARDTTTVDLARCPAWVVGNAEGRGYYHVHWKTPAGTPPRTAAEQLAHGEDVAAAIARGELATGRAELDALFAKRDPYAELAAIAIATELDRRVDEATSGRWFDELAAKLARRLSRSAIWTPRTSLEVAFRDALTALVPPDRFPRETTQHARQLVERALRDGPMALPWADLVLALSLAAPAGGAPLFERIVGAAAANTAFFDEWFEGLGSFDATLAPRAVELVLDRRFDPTRAWAAIGGMLGRTQTRAAAWRAIRARATELLSTLGAEDAAMMIDATASLCERSHHREVEAAFRPAIGTVVNGKRALDDALTAIDRCITRARR